LESDLPIRIRKIADILSIAEKEDFAPASSATAAAFKTTPSNPEINQATIDAVANYFSEHRGEHYSPHVTIGVGTVDYQNALLAAPFPTFTFSAAGASAYQFGNFGTAAKRLHCFSLTQ
jgi:hypothetical protein